MAKSECADLATDLEGDTRPAGAFSWALIPVRHAFKARHAGQWSATCFAALRESGLGTDRQFVASAAIASGIWGSPTSQEGPRDTPGRPNLTPSGPEPRTHAVQQFQSGFERHHLIVWSRHRG
jgi:hypothetical protein